MGSFPTTPEEIGKAVNGFASKSTREVMRGCVGALNGLHVFMKAPHIQGGLYNVRSFFSGETVEQIREWNHLEMKDMLRECPYQRCRYYWGKEDKCIDERCHGESNTCLVLLSLRILTILHRTLHGLRYRSPGRI